MSEETRLMGLRYNKSDMADIVDLLVPIIERTGLFNIEFGPGVVIDLNGKLNGNLNGKSNGEHKKIRDKNSVPNLLLLRLKDKGPQTRKELTAYAIEVARDRPKAAASAIVNMVRRHHARKDNDVLTLTAMGMKKTELLR